MTYDYAPVTWSDGESLTAANSANRWETALDGISNDLSATAGQVDSLVQFVTAGSATGYRQGQTADAGTPTVGGQLFYNQQTSELWIPGGAAWYKVALTAVSGVSGGSNAPTGFTAVVNSDSTISLAWTLPTPPGGNTITAVTVREKIKSPGGVSGMPLAGSATTNTRSASLTAATREYYVTCTFSGGTESAESNHVTVFLPYGSTGTGGGGGTSTGTGTPASILGIGSTVFFSVDIGNAGGANVSHTMAELVSGYVQDPYLAANAAGDAVQFSCFANSGTTSGSTHPRTELREVKSDGTTKAAWNMGVGTHIMSGTSTITHLPADAESSGSPKPWTCFGQIHDAAGDVVRLQVEGSAVASLALKSRTHSPNGSASTEVTTTIQSSYTVGDPIDWKIEVINGTCKLYIGGVVQKTITLSGTGGYFKTGDYQQFSTASGDGQYGSGSNAKVELKSLVVTHSPAL